MTQQTAGCALFFSQANEKFSFESTITRGIGKVAKTFHAYELMFALLMYVDDCYKKSSDSNDACATSGEVGLLGLSYSLKSLIPSTIS